MADSRFVRNAYDLLLIQRAKHGNRDAFGKLYRIHLDAIYRYVYFRVGQDRAVAEDITQDIFLKAWKKKDQFRLGNGTVRAWLYKVATTTTIDYFRTNKPVVRMHEEVADGSLVDEEVVKRDEIRRLFSALHVLTPEQKQVLIMRYVNDLSTSEIGSVLKISNDAVRALQYRALKNLRRTLRK